MSAHKPPCAPPPIVGRLSLCVLLALLLLPLSSSGAGEPETKDGKPSIAEGLPHDEPSLTIVDEAGKVHQITATDISRLPHRKVKAKSHETEAEYEGVSLVDLLQSIGVVFGKELKGPRTSTVVLLEATDKYRAAIALLEIDPETTEKLVLFVDRRDGQPLDKKEGPFRLVIPDEKRPVRWIRMIRAIRLVNLKDLPLDDAPSTKLVPESK